MSANGTNGSNGKGGLGYIPQITTTATYPTIGQTQTIQNAGGADYTPGVTDTTFPPGHIVGPVVLPTQQPPQPAPTFWNSTINLPVIGETPTVLALALAGFLFWYFVIRGKK